MNRALGFFEGHALQRRIQLEPEASRGLVQGWPSGAWLAVIFAKSGVAHSLGHVLGLPTRTEDPKQEAKRNSKQNSMKNKEK